VNGKVLGETDGETCIALKPGLESEIFCLLGNVLSLVSSTINYKYGPALKQKIFFKQYRKPVPCI